MFKKDLPPQKLNLLKNKEIKALKKEVGIQFPLLQKEDVDSFFNSFQGLISVSKLETRTLLYYVNNIPYLFDVEGRNKLFPTIHFLFIFPHTLRSIYIHSPVSEYILRGADLFSPGIATYEGLESLNRFEKVSVSIIGNPLPFAVGESNVSYEGILVNRGQGRAVCVLQYYSDKLTLGACPNPGFNLNIITPIVVNKGISELVSVDSSKNEKCDTIEVTTNSDVSCNANEAGSDNEVNESIVKLDELILETIEEADDSVDIKAVVNSKSHSNVSDQTIVRGLLVALRYLIKDDQLPYLVSNLWKLVQKSIACDPINFEVSSENTLENTTISESIEEKYQYNLNLQIDIKKSSFKQVSSLLTHVNNEYDNIIEVSNENGILHLNAVDRSHKVFRSVTLDNATQFKENIKVYGANVALEKAKVSLHKADLLKSQQDASSVKTIPLDNIDSGLGSSKSSSSSTNFIKMPAFASNTESKMRIIDLYKFPRQLRDIFVSNELALKATFSSSSIEVFTVHEIKEMLSSFILSYNLEDDTDRKQVIIPPENILFTHIKSNVNKAQSRGTKDSDDSTIVTRPESSVDTAYIPEDFEDFDEEDLPKHLNNNNVVGGVAVTNILSQIHKNSDKDSSTVSDNTVKKVWKPIYLPAPPIKSNSGTQLHEKSNASYKMPESNVQPVDFQRITVRKDELFEIIVKKLSPYNALVLPTGDVKISFGKPPVISLTKQKRAGNKIITSVRGLEAFGVNMDQLVKDFKKKFACSVTISPIKGIDKESEVLIQGSADVNDILVTKFGVPSKCISFK